SGGVEWISLMLLIFLSQIGHGTRNQKRSQITGHQLDVINITTLRFYPIYEPKKNWIILPSFHTVPNDYMNPHHHGQREEKISSGGDSLIRKLHVSTFVMRIILIGI
ncbi:hypothetical protein ACJX0J_005925, partial [Zea mays]